MEWNWILFFEKLEDHEAACRAIENHEAACRAIENLENYDDGAVTVSYILDWSDDELPPNFRYGTWSNKLFQLTCEGLSISIDRKYLDNFMADHKKRIQYENDQGSEAAITYIGYAFMLDVFYSSQVSSGEGHYKNLLRKLLELVNNGGINIEGENEITTTHALDVSLKDEVLDFTTVAKVLGSA
jgi:hypothetical protein